ncbi:MBL fold metallo-hydrolase [Natranaeroarchaeum aerophilus]|uniref:MBL fold metallo-hydrolase n=1 Tax=Natranaeroarchaeum aerophilus TaxID=2917711 RepID=A0AAE3FTH0_9EURY|nr:MBL fold metallo-hydrolase [Natranaeroarchaeum aerophilus]MCL9814730.1 MBL fold metallo-hydrolase [Natranaeroarchaeum aerophilus]
MEVTLLGTGDTTGTPTLDCECDTCEYAREHGIERTRFSVYLENDRTDEALLIDASPDFRHQFEREDVALPDSIVITHVHFDHLDGLGNVYRLLRDAPVYAANETDPVTGESVAETVNRKYSYLDAIDVQPTAPFETVRTCGFDVTLVPVDHPPLLCYGVVIEDPETGAKLTLSGDTNYAIPEDSRAAMANPDLLLADGIVPAQVAESHHIGGDHHDDEGVARTFGSKHMTREGAIALGDDLNAERTRLVHVAHYYPVDEAFEEPLAVDGERFSL